jgi:Zn-dependent protease
MNEQGIAYTVAVWLIPLVIAIVFHEVAHGWVARAFGDPTAARLGRLTLNPIKHVDPVGTVGLPLVLAVVGAPIFGWAKPVPVVAAQLRNPRWQMMLVALAGPATNFVLALLAAAALGAAFAWSGGAFPREGVGGFAIDNVFNFLLINIFLGVFNLIPLPPFDGGHVVEGLLPRAALPAWRKLALLGFPIMLVLLVVLPMLSPQANVVGRVIAPIVAGVVRTLLGMAGIAG